MNDRNDKEIIEVKEVEAERINNNETFRLRFKAIRLSPLFLVGILIYVVTAFWGLLIFIIISFLIIALIAQLVEQLICNQ